MVPTGLSWVLVVLYHYILSVVSGKINAYAHSDQVANLRCVHE